MPTIESDIDLRSPEARTNDRAMRALVADLRDTAERVRVGGERRLVSGIWLVARCCPATASGP